MCVLCVCMEGKRRDGITLQSVLCVVLESKGKTLTQSQSIPQKVQHNLSLNSRRKNEILNLQLATPQL